MRRITMLKTERGASDRINVTTLEAGKTYTVSDSLADNFCRQQGIAEPAPEPEAKDAGAAPENKDAGAAPENKGSNARPPVNRKVRELAAELGVDISTVKGTGKRGAIKLGDVRTAAG